MELVEGLWGSASGHYVRCGVQGDAEPARTAGWDADLCWQTNVWDGLLAGVAYDGHGECRVDGTALTGAAPSPFQALGIRSIENHAVTLNLSSTLGDAFWFSGYAGWVQNNL